MGVQLSSEEIAEFLGIPAGDELVTRALARNTP